MRGEVDALNRTLSDAIFVSFAKSVAPAPPAVTPAFFVFLGAEATFLGARGAFVRGFLTAGGPAAAGPFLTLGFLGAARGFFT